MKIINVYKIIAQSQKGRHMNKDYEFTNREKSRLRRYLHRIFDIRADMMTYEEIAEMMEENTIIQGANMWILMLAILIASIGLNVNSTAVIIGAMLISPLMSGILTMGYALAVRDLTMMKKAMGRFTTQVVISLIVSSLYFLITPLDIPTNEMIARTSPTLWDVSIALFGGIAGMIGNTRNKKGNVVPGVAIATALMPPLCTAGYGLATWQPRFLLGAFYLFAINTLFIMLSSALVTYLLRVPVKQHLDQKKQKKINYMVALITIVTVLPSILIGSATVYNSVMERNIAEYLNNEFVFEDTQMVQNNTDSLNHVISVSLVGAPVSDEVLERLEQSLKNYNITGYKLRVTQNQIQAIETDNTDVITIAVQEKSIQDLQAKLDEQQKLLDTYEQAEEEIIDFKQLAENAASIFTKLSDCACGMMSDTNGNYILLTATIEEPLTEEEEQTITNWLKTESKLENAKVDFVVVEPEEETEEVE